MNDEALGRDAHLSGILAPGLHGQLDRQIYIGVFPHDETVEPAQLHHALLEMLASQLRQMRPRGRRPREAQPARALNNAFRLRVTAEHALKLELVVARLPDNNTKPEQLLHSQPRQRTAVARTHDDRVPQRQRRDARLKHKPNRVVERNHVEYRTRRLQLVKRLMRLRFYSNRTQKLL